jgi:hypothetical protein
MITQEERLQLVEQQHADALVWLDTLQQQKRTLEAQIEEAQQAIERLRLRLLRLGQGAA